MSTAFVLSGGGSLGAGQVGEAGDLVGGDVAGHRPEELRALEQLKAAGIESREQMFIGMTPLGEVSPLVFLAVLVSNP